MKIMNKFNLTILTAASLFIMIPSANAQQTPSLDTQKRVVSSFKINDSQDFFPFPASECADKTRGDANCDGQVNEFDLSVWQVEFNSIRTPQSPRRSDFNEDGFINLADYAIWKETTSPKTTASIWNQFINWITVNAQTPPSQLSSSVLNLQSGNTQIVNSSQNGASQQITFDQNGIPVSAATFNQNGQFLLGIAFTSAGDTITSTEQDGISISINKTSQGPVIEYFSNPDGTLLAIKSWPTVQSLEQNDPPLAVTLPVKGKFLTLNINPNDTSVVVKSDDQGNIVDQTQFRKDGTYINQNLNSDIQTESNTEIGLSTIQMPNNLGGKTTYNFYKDGFFALVQTDSSGNYHIAKPLDAQGNSWSLESTVDGKTSTQTVDNPVSKIGSNTPNPKDIIRDINYYQALSLPEGLNFQDGFGSSASISTSQITQANQVLKVESANPPSQTSSSIPSSFNFGIKEAHAETVETEVNFPEDDDDDNKGNSKSRTGGDEDKNNRSSSNTAASIAPAVKAQAAVGIGNNTAKVAVAGGSQTNQIVNPAGAVVASNTTNSNQNNAVTNGQGNSVGVNTGQSQTAAGAATNPLYDARTLIGTPSTQGTPTAPPMMGPTTCFLAGTKVSTPFGPKNIEDLKPGDKVYSFNEKTKRKEVSDFDKLDINFVDEYLIINHKIQTTTYHPFYISENGLLSLAKAGTLKIGNLLVNESNNLIPIYSIQKIEKKETVYNLLTVTPNNNFYAEGLLVHNYQPDEYTQGRGGNGAQPSNENWSDYSMTVESPTSPGENWGGAPSDVTGGVTETNTQSDGNLDNSTSVDTGTNSSNDSLSNTN